MKTLKILKAALLAGSFALLACNCTAPAPKAAPAPVVVAPSTPPPPAPLVLPPIDDPAPDEAACRGGDVKACERAAEIHYSGWGVPRDMAKVGEYAEIACKAKSEHACLLRDLTRLSDHSSPVLPGIQSYRYYLESFEPGYGPGPWCTELKGRDPWGFGAYYKSDCHRAEMEATLSETAVPSQFEVNFVESACFDHLEANACRGMILSTSENNLDGERFAVVCQIIGVGCGVANGKSPEETLQFRKKGCLRRDYDVCEPLWNELYKQDPLMAQRVEAEVCFHPYNAGVPKSANFGGYHRDFCDLENFNALAISTEPADQALMRALTPVLKALKARKEAEDANPVNSEEEMP